MSDPDAGSDDGHVAGEGRVVRRLGIAVGEPGERHRDALHQEKESRMDFGPQADDVPHGPFVCGDRHFSDSETVSREDYAPSASQLKATE